MSKKIYKAYCAELPFVEVPHMPLNASRAPAASDTEFAIGDVWIYKPTVDTGSSYVYCGLDSSGDAIWILQSPGTSEVDTINSLSPVAGDILIDGGTNITDSNAGHTVTLNLDAAITLATSVTSPLYTASAADAVLVAGGANDVVFRVGDNAGATFFRFQDSDSADVYTIDSNGSHTAFSGLTVTGAFTQTAGIANIGADAAANAVNIGTGAAAKVVTIGSVNGASSLDLLAGTGNFSLEGNIATTYAISNVGINTGQVDIAGGTGARTINIGPGGTGAKTINIGAAASADVITIGTNDGASSLSFVCGTGNFALDGVGASTYNIGASTTGGTISIGGTSQTGTITLGDSDGVNIVEIGAGEGATTVNIAGGATAAKAVNIATGLVANTIALGSASAGAITLDTAAGFSLDAATASNITVTSAGLDLSIQGVGCAVNMSSSEATSDAISIEASDAAGGVAILAGSGGVNIGNEADCSALTLGDIAPTVSRSITIGSGTVVTAAVTDTISIGDGGATTNANSIKNVDINNGGVAVGEVNTSIACGAVTSGTHLTEIATGNVAGGTASINMATGTGTQSVSIASGAGPKALTLGSTNTTSSTIIQAGSGDITVTGTVQDLSANFIRQNGEAITFSQSPIIGSSLNTGVAATGATGDINLLSFQNGIMMEQFVLGAGQTIIKPVMTATGLLISGDETASEGYEYNWGAARANSKHSFTIGTDAAFYLQWTFRADDISGLEPCYCGFRKTQANQVAGAIASYTDFVAYGLNDGISPGDCAISTQLNTGGLINTDTNDAWADAATHTLRINVSAAGVVTFLFDGGAPTATQAYTFDNADVVHPFFRHEFNAALPGAIEWISMECGYQA